MKKLLALLLLTAPAFGQSVQQSGNITPGHGAQWITNGVIGDSGAPSGGVGLLGSFVINDMLCSNATGTTISIIDCGFSATGTNNWVGLQNLNGGATAPTRSPGDSTTNVATTAFVAASSVNLLATINTWTALQNFNGGATAPTRTALDSTTNVATTAFVTASNTNQLSTANTWTATQQFGSPWVQANVYAAGSTGASGVAARGTLASPNTDGVATWIVQSVANFNGIAPALYASTIKEGAQGAMSGAYGLAAWGEAKDLAGGGSVSGGRWAASCVGGTGGNCTGATNLGVASVSYAYVIGAENQAWNSTGVDATTTFSAAKFATPVLSTCAGTNKCDAAFLVNDNIVIPNAGVTPDIDGIHFPALTLDSTGSVLRAETATTYGVNLLNATCSTACFRSPSFQVDGSGNITSNSETTTALITANLLISKTAPVIGSCGGGSPAISANNGTAAFRVTVGSATSTCAITLPTATTGWNCYATDLTTTSTTVFVTKQTVSGASGVTLGNFNDVASAANWGTSDVLAVSCFAL
jgi:hypothetical protein